jgi:hypothetical protein
MLLHPFKHKSKFSSVYMEEKGKYIKEKIHNDNNADGVNYIQGRITKNTRELEIGVK